MCYAQSNEMQQNFCPDSHTAFIILRNSATCNTKKWLNNENIIHDYYRYIFSSMAFLFSVTALIRHTVDGSDDNDEKIYRKQSWLALLTIHILYLDGIVINNREQNIQCQFPPYSTIRLQWCNPIYFSIRHGMAYNDWDHQCCKIRQGFGLKF